MSYEKQNFISGQVLSASQLNHMEEGIENAQKLRIGTVSSGMVPGAEIVNCQLNLVLPKGERGDAGETGLTPALSVGAVTKGDEASASITGTAEKPVLNLILPKGDKGDTGDTGLIGPKGETGVTPAFSVGAVTKGDEVGASITGTAENPVLNLTLPKGDKGDTGLTGPKGETGVTPAFSMGAVTKGDEASASITGTAEKPVLNLILPKGDKGDRGEKGDKGDKGGPELDSTLTISGQAADAKVTGDSIRTEAARAQQAEAANTQYINTEVQRAQQAEEKLAETVSGETQRAQQMEQALSRQIVNAQFPYRIVYDHSYDGTGSHGTAYSPVRIPLAGDYDAVAVIRTEMRAYPADSESPKRRVLLELVTQEAAYNTFKDNYITLAGLPASFVSAGAVNPGLNVMYGNWSLNSTYLRYQDRTLELYLDESIHTLPHLVWNESGLQYHVFGITWNGGTLHG